MTEGRRSTRRRLLARAWGWWLARIVILGLTLYSCLFLLQTMALLADLGMTYGSSSIQLDPEKTSLSGVKLTLAGRAPDRSLLQVGTGNRVLATGIVQPDGTFQMEAPRPRRTLSLWIRALDREEGRQHGKHTLLLEAPLLDDSPLAVDLALQIADPGQLWVAGQGPPGRILSIVADGVAIGEAKTDAWGVFDALLETETAPREVRAAHRSESSEPALVTPTLSAVVPLSRVADFRWTEAELQGSVRIVLPAAHPYFVGLLDNSFPPFQFVERVFGYLPLMPRPGDPVTVTMLDGKGSVDIELRASRGSGSVIGFFASNSEGIGSTPLWSGNDRIAVDYGQQALWLVPPLPSEMVDGRATWRGPLASRKQDRLEITLGRGSQLLAEPRQSPQEESREPAEQRNLREFVQRFEGQVRANLLRQTWRALIVLIPFLVLLYLARTARFGRAETWKNLAAAAAILAIWRSWPFLLDWVAAGPGSWLNRLIAPAVWGTGIATPDEVAPWFQKFWKTPYNVFWLLFVALAGMVPLYFDDAVQAGLRWRPRFPRRPRARWRRILGGGVFVLRTLASLLLLALLVLTLRWLLSSERWLGVSKFESRLLIAWMPDWIGSDLGLAFSTLLLWALLLLCIFGLRGGLFGLSLVAVGARWAVEGGVILDRDLSRAVAEVPWWLVLALAGLTAWPFVVRLLGALVPFTREQRRVRQLVAAALVVLSLLLPRLPASWLLACAGGFLVLGLGWVVVQGLPGIGILARLGAWADRSRAVFLSSLFVLGLILAWPFRLKTPGLVELSSFASELGQVFPYVLAAGVILVLLDYARNRQNVLLPPEILKIGGLFYAVFLLNSSSTWLFVPVAFLTGLLLAGVWLFRPKTETDKLAAALPEGQRNPRLLIQSVIDSTELGSRFLKIRQALAEKLEKMDLKPQEYEERLAEYQAYLKSKANRQELPYGLEPRELVFAVGEPTILDNIVTALRWGAILSIGPLLIAIYQYLPTRGVPHAFPIMDLLTFLIGALASWLLYAFFFGYFFVHLRGHSGLTKGCHLFSLVAIPFAVYHLLHAPTLDQVRPFLLWVVQLFLFFTLLGLLAFDYGLLRKNGFRFKDLRLVHDLPALSAYASTVVAAVIPAIGAVLTGEVKDLVSFFLENILPRVPS